MAFGAFVGQVEKIFGGGGDGFDELPISSKCFSSLAYNKSTQQLRMTFRKGGVYTIPKIDKEEVDRWVREQSVGLYFNEYVRGNY